MDSAYFHLSSLPLFLGYVIRVFRGANPSPQFDDWSRMFIDGFKLFIVAVIYALPA